MQLCNSIKEINRTVGYKNHLLGVITPLCQLQYQKKRYWKQYPKLCIVFALLCSLWSNITEMYATVLPE